LHVDPKSVPGGRATAFLVDYLGSSNFPIAALYLAVLVGVTGQSFGMMIVGLRVVEKDFRRPGILRTLWRYAIGWVLWVPILFLAPFMRRVMLHDRWSGTRLIRNERVLARNAAVTSQAPGA
jgi:uncharacterized RDD family membrane protein YckC